MRKQKNPGIRQVAKEAGVSIYTVSSVLNDKGDISAATRDRVLKAIKKLDYDPLRNLPLARKAQRTTFGLVLPDIASPSDTYFYRSITAATDAGRELGHEVKIFTQKDLEFEDIGYSPEGIRFGCTAFLFFMPEGAWQSQVRILQTKGVGIAVVGRSGKIPGIRMFTIDRNRSVEQALIHLADQGCRSIGLSVLSVGGQDKGPVNTYRIMVDKLNLVADDRLIAARERNRGADPSLPFIGLIRKKVKVDGILFSADRFAVRAIRGFWKAGISVPDDVMVAGINDDPVASEIIPSLTTVRVPVEKMVADACRALHESSSARKEKPACKTYGQEMVIRESTS